MSNVLKAILIDDEKDAIDSLSKILTEFIEGVEIIGSAQTIKEGLTLIENTTFDLLFLDVNMRKDTGFDLLEKAGPIPANIIFVTAFDHYAIKAFKYSASDYLMKPVDIQELRSTIKRIRRSNESKHFFTMAKSLSLYVNTMVINTPFFKFNYELILTFCF